ncbi:hypothetical protein JYU14_00645 [Simkania negevensis]|uniref:Flagellin N-terminal domain-containing protein n=1 Tax=Simkania negevensis TaxID=83561 RepID=A0ABS3AU98_9BACT|nr:hypothetical protein [Simkania negevensis]
MVLKINAEHSAFLQQFKRLDIRLSSSAEQLSSGKRLIRPGTDPVDFERVRNLNSDIASQLASSRSLQIRNSWYSAGVSYLTHVRELLTSMSELAMRGSSAILTTNDYKSIDAQFQQAKEGISALIDGRGGAGEAAGIFNDLPLFVGFSPDVALGDPQLAEAATQNSIALYTGLGQAGFSTMALIEQGKALAVSAVPAFGGTALAGTTTTLSLPTSASTQNDAYAGLELITTGGSGAGQRATIIGYDGTTRVATIETKSGNPLSTSLNVGTQFVIAPPYATASLNGTATAGSASSITLDDNAAFFDNVYVGMELFANGGAGSGQQAVIISYDAVTRTAAIAKATGGPLDTSLGAGTEYTILSSQENVGLVAIGDNAAVRFAEQVWGADNDRSDLLFEPYTFRSITEEERNFRQANTIPNTNLDPQTNEEKLQRRERNIFDSEFGRVDTQEKAKTMFSQTLRAIDQIAILITKEAAKSEVMIKEFERFQQANDWSETGAGAFDGLDIAESIVSFQELTTAHAMVSELAVRLSETFGKLNELVRNKGVRS